MKCPTPAEKNVLTAAAVHVPDLYVGLSPYTAPSAFSLLAATELTDESTLSAGGFAKLRWHWRRGPNRLGWRSSWRRRLRR